MQPEEIVLQLKKNGTFDDLRKRLLNEFQNGEEGQNFLNKLKLFMEDMVEKDPTLLEKESSTFHELVSAEIEKAGIYKAIREEAVEALKGDYYQTRINEEIRILTEKSETDGNK